MSAQTLLLGVAVRRQREAAEAQGDTRSPVLQLVAVLMLRVSWHLLPSVSEMICERRVPGSGELTSSTLSFFVRPS